MRSAKRFGQLGDAIEISALDHLLLLAGKAGRTQQLWFRYRPAISLRIQLTMAAAQNPVRIKSDMISKGIHRLLKRLSGPRRNRARGVRFKPPIGTRGSPTSKCVLQACCCIRHATFPMFLGVVRGDGQGSQEDLARGLSCRTYIPGGRLRRLWREFATFGAHGS